jgi:hypothetical protein
LSARQGIAGMNPGLGVSRGRPSTAHVWVKVSQSNPSIGGGESPFDGAAVGVAVFLPSGRRARKVRGAADAAVEALSPEHPRFDLGDVQPASAARRVVNLQPPSLPASGCLGTTPGANLATGRKT